MPRNYFTDEQIKILEENPYVLKVSKANAVFTEDFKREFMRLYESGLGPSEILAKLGIDPKQLGKRRIDKLSDRIRKQSSRPEGFSRKENSSKGKARKKRHPEFRNDSEKAEYYKEYSEKLEQEIELLKKIRALEK